MKPSNLLPMSDTIVVLECSYTFETRILDVVVFLSPLSFSFLRVSGPQLVGAITLRRLLLY